jgi:hypothetical protein
MKVSRLKSEKRLDTYSNRGLGIQTYGEYNDFPQRIAEIVEASVTGNSCTSIYTKFIVGRGFADADFYAAVCDSKGTTVDALLQSVGEDYARFGGFAIHVNYNALHEIVSASHFPFEWLRFENLDEEGNFNRLAAHPDWGRRYTKLRQFRQKDIEHFHFFNSDPEVIDAEVAEAGGWNGYKGQIFYFSNKGQKVYPTPIFEAAVTDMSNEEGLSNITQRNVKNNFLPSGMVVDYDNTSNSEKQEEETKEELREFQGDMNAGKLLYINIKNGEQKPDFVPFVGKNFDRDFEQAEKKTPQIIGRAFSQPPILRAEDVGANFGADLMRNAYDYYNSITESERDILSRVFKRIFDLWHDPAINVEKNYKIVPKYYRVNATLAERLAQNIDKVLELLADKDMSERAKFVILSVVYGVEEDEINELLEGLRT